MDANRNVTEALAILGVISPSSQGVGEALSGPVNMSRYRRLFAAINIGAVGGAGTVDAKFVASATSGGTYTAVTGTSITQIAAASKIVVIELKAETLQAAGQGPYVKLSLTVGGNAVLTAAIVYGAGDRYEPASDANLAAVAQLLVA